VEYVVEEVTPVISHRPRPTPAAPSIASPAKEDSFSQSFSHDEPDEVDEATKIATRINGTTSGILFANFGF
jgi:hypothetical protein